MQISEKRIIFAKNQNNQIMETKKVYIKRLTAENLKAVVNQDILLNGASIIIRGRNDSGKSTVARGMQDRFNGKIPSPIVNKYAEKGKEIMELTDGCKIEWAFTKKSERFIYHMGNNIKQTTGVIKAMNEKYFGKEFYIDDFFAKKGKEKVKYLFEILDIDLTEIEEEYSKAYKERTDANSNLKYVKGKDYSPPKKIEKPNLKPLEDKLQKIKDKNKELKDKWQIESQKHLENIQDFNKKQKEYADNLEKSNSILLYLHKAVGIFEGFGHKMDISATETFVEKMPRPKDEKPLLPLKEPDYLPTDEISQKIAEANKKLVTYNNYERDLEKYENWKKEVEEAQKKADDLDDKVKSILAKKQSLLQSAKLPSEFKITEEGILLYNGLPFNDSQMSTSSKYIGGLKLSKVCLAELHTRHFDASSLDPDNLMKVLDWAHKNELQLLVEVPEAGDMRYEVIESEFSEKS